MIEKRVYDTDGQLSDVKELATAGSTQPDTQRTYQRTLKRVNVLVAKEAGSLVRQEGYRYDGQGRKTTTKTYRSGTSDAGTAVGINDDGQVTWVSDPGRFDPVASSPTQSQQFTYDEFGNLVTVKQLVAGSWIVSAAITWDIQGNISSFADSKGVTIQYRHDDFGRLVEAQSPDFGLRRFVYDESGNLIGERRGDGQLIQYSYDAANRLTSVKFQIREGDPPTSLETWAWNGVTVSVTNCAGGSLPAPLGAGRLTHVTDAAGDWYFGYWPDGRLRYESLVSPGATCGKTLSWEYSSDGLPTAMVYPSGARVQYTYPAAGAAFHDRPQSVTLVTGTGQTTLASSIVWGQGEVLGYSTPSRSWKLARALDGTPTTVDSPLGGTRSLTFGGFDGWGNPRSIQETVFNQATSAQLNTFTTNDLPALTGATVPGYSPQAIAYLASGDRKSVNGAAYCYASGTHQLASIRGQSLYSYTPEGAVQRKLSIDGSISTLCYGPRGEVLTEIGGGGEVNRLITNFRRQRTAEIWPLNGMREDFRVDESSRLLVEAGAFSLTAQYPRPTREYVWLGDHPIATIDSTEASNGTVAQQGVTYLFSGQFGEILTEADSSGSVIRQYEYAPFGERREISLLPSEVPAQVSLSRFALPGGGFTPSLFGTLSVSSDARAIRAHFTDSALVGCTIAIRDSVDSSRWLAQISSAQLGALTDWLPTSSAAFEVSGCGDGGVSWNVGVGVQLDVGSLQSASVDAGTTRPYPAAGQHFSLVLNAPSYVQFDAVDLATCDKLEARNTAGQTLWQWKPGSYNFLGFPIPDTTGSTSKLTGTVEVGIWGAGCNSSQLKGGFTISKVRRESTSQVQAPVSIGLPGQKIRYDGTLDNWHRWLEPATGRYLSPEPMLQVPNFVRVRAKTGHLGSVYGYASEQPLRTTDATGLFDTTHLRVCANFMDALDKARTRAGCKNPKCGCQEKLAQCGYCDICKILDPDKGPFVLRGDDMPKDWLKLKAVTCEPRTFFNSCKYAGRNDFSSPTKDGWAVILNQELCSDGTLVDELASTMIHEAAHACKMFGENLGPGPDPGGDDGSSCNAYAIARACK